jgi:hypothetical protein
VVNATPRPLYPRERPGTHSIGGWVGLRASLDRCGKSHLPTGIRSLDRTARSESLYRLSYLGSREEKTKLLDNRNCSSYISSITDLNGLYWDRTGVPKDRSKRLTNWHSSRSGFRKAHGVSWPDEKLLPSHGRIFLQVVKWGEKKSVLLPRCISTELKRNIYGAEVRALTGTFVLYKTDLMSAVSAILTVRNCVGGTKFEPNIFTIHPLSMRRKIIWWQWPHQESLVYKVLINRIIWWILAARDTKNGIHEADVMN